MFRTIRLFIAGIACSIPMAAVLPVSAQDPPAAKAAELNPGALIGAWKVVKVDGKDLKEAEQIGIEFTKTGKMKVNFQDRANYKIEGDKLLVTPIAADAKAESRTVTIKKSSPELVVLYDEKEKSEIELKKGGSDSPPTIEKK